MKQLLQILLLLQMTAVFAFGASVKATVDDPNVVEGNSIRLTLEAVGNDVEFPRIDIIGPYTVEGKTSMTSMGITSINGQNKIERISKLVMTFVPDKPITIPSFTIKVDGKEMHTDPIEIKIVKSAAPTPASSKKFNLDMVANKQQVYVGEPLLLSVFFNESRQVDLMKVEYQKPTFKDFFVKEVGDEKTYRKGAYLVHELRYLLTPKRDGNLTIEPARAKVAERSQRKDEFFGTFFDTPKWSQIASRSLNLEVKALPKQTDLVGDLKLSEKIDAAKVKANKPVNLTITISGEGNLEDFDGLKYDIDGVTVYSDAAKVDSKLVGNQLISSYEKKFVFISDHNFTIPSKSFPLFNFKTEKVEELKTESYQIEISGGHVSAPVTVQSAKPQQTPGSETKADEVYKEKGEIRTEALNPWMLLLAFGGGVLLTLGAVKLPPSLRWKRKPNPMKESEALKTLYPHTNDNPEVEAMVRKLYAKRGGDKNVIIDKKELKRLVDQYRES
ncbi:MAG: BatD family protein [Campylobacterota bacterium]|nr:BatD family protein [Campylobacterota bacterium]